MREQEKGFALLITLGILVGILSIVVPLVVLNNQKLKEVSNTSLETQSLFTTHNAKTLSLYHSKSPTNGTSRIQQWYRLPGWRDDPLVLKPTSTTVSGTSISIQGGLIVPFMAYASNYDSYDTPLFLTGSDMSYTNTTNFTYTNGSGTENYGNDKFVIINNELILNNGGTLNRGQGGSRTSHKVGSPVYVLPDKDHYLYINNERVTIEPSDWNCTTGAFTNISITSTHNNVYSVFLSANPNLFTSSGANAIVTSMRSEFIDERSKININSLSSDMINNIFQEPIQTSGTTISTMIRNTITSGSGHPFKTPQSVMQAFNLGTSSSNITLPQFSGIKNMITTFSEPLPRYINNTLSEAVVTDSRPPTILVSSTNTNSFFLQHPVNFNTASEAVMTSVLFELGNSTTLNTYSNAKSLSEAIARRRSGETSTQVIDYSDGDEDPFDGVSGGVQYGSPEEEFRNFLNNLASPALSSSDITAIMAHTQARIFEEYGALSKVTTPICFEPGLVNTLKVHTVAQRKRTAPSGNVRYRPGVNKTRSYVIKDFNNWGGNTIVLNSTKGWNEWNSTFQDIDYRQPIISSLSPNSHTIYLDENTSANHIYGYLSGNIGHESFEIARFSANLGTGNQLVLFDNSSLTTTNAQKGVMLDIGLRAKAEHAPSGNHVYTTTANTYTTGDPELELSGTLSASGWSNSGTLYYHNPTVANQYALLNYSNITDYTTTSNLTITSAVGGNTNIPTGTTIYYDAFINTRLSNTNKPFYETQLFRENVEWDNVRIFGKYKGAINWKYKIENDSSWTDGGATNSGNQYLNIDRQGSHLKLLFEFSNSTLNGNIFNGGWNSSPQIFEIQINYTPLGPKRIIYHQE